MAITKNMEVSHNNMLCLFSGGELEMPYRFQPDLCFTVGFKEYKAFVKDLLDCNLNCLSFSQDVYKKALNSGDDTVIKKCYYFDLSNAVLNEVCMAASFGTDGTVIKHKFDNPDLRVVKVDKLDEEIVNLPMEYVTKAVNTLKTSMSWSISVNDLSKHNKWLWRYALYLRANCYSANIEEIILEG